MIYIRKDKKVYEYYTDAKIEKAIMIMLDATDVVQSATDEEYYGKEQYLRGYFAGREEVIEYYNHQT